jgi:hypothetical protein
MTNNYHLWNDTSVTHLLVRLISKRNHPYNESLLTESEFKKDYIELIHYIEWRKPIQTIHSLYDFTEDNMVKLISLISWDKDNREELLTLWNEIVKKEWDD